MINILYQDEAVIAVEKPAGMLVLGQDKAGPKDLTGQLNDIVRSQGHGGRVYPCHRIDKETSGVVLYAWGKLVQQKMMQQFRDRTVEKLYLALVYGRPSPPQGTLRSYIKDVWPYERKGPKKLALTRYQVIDRGRGFSVIRCGLITGRTNQIRIQFSEFGHPLVGERRFALARDNKPRFRRAALHAWQVGCRHPISNKPLCFVAPLAADMKDFLKGQGVNVPSIMV